MRLGLILLLCLVNTGCALWRRDRAEPVENGPREQKAEPVLKPSEALKPKSLDIASPVSDHFYMRGIYFQGTVDTVLRIDSTGATEPDGTVLSGEDDLGLDDVVDQARMEFDIRMGERNHVRIDYFKLNRFSEQPLPRDIEFGDFEVDEGEVFRTRLDWRMLGLTYTYSLFRAERFEAGLGLGLHIIETLAEGSQPLTSNRERDSEAAVFPTVAVTGAFRISKRWAVTARGQSFSYTDDEEGFDGSLSDYHIDVQYRWRRNFAIGLGYSAIDIDLEVADADNPFLFQMNTSGPEIFFRASF
ncbi:MAG TPA: hypothetical protein VFU13_12880 [Steroidobacteraceae bacterium]|nr:hypothetical protein [Steroidobacteraceae bacterium]